MDTSLIIPKSVGKFIYCYRTIIQPCREFELINWYLSNLHRLSNIHLLFTFNLIHRGTLCRIDVCLLISSFIHVHAHCMMWNHTDISKLSRNEGLVSAQPFFFFFFFLLAGTSPLPVVQQALFNFTCASRRLHGRTDIHVITTHAANNTNSHCLVRT